MATKNNPIIPQRATHPGEILGEELLERGIKQKDFALQIGVQPSHLNAFIKGKRNLNEDLAMKLEDALAIPFQIWMNFHNNYVYQSKLIEQRSEEEQKASAFETLCIKIINLPLLYKRLGCTGMSLLTKVKHVQALFPFDLLRAQEELQVAGCFKHSEKLAIDERNMLTWLLLNQVAILQTQGLNTYQQGYATQAAQEIAAMANQGNTTVKSIQQCLRKYGISFIEVEKVDKAPIDAYSTIVNGNPIITATFRCNDMDKLVFDILHELCHIDRHLKGKEQGFVSMDGSEYSSDPREKEANEFARNMLISPHLWKELMSIACKDLTPYAVVHLIAKKAMQMGISPSIAIARYKRESKWYQTNAYKSPKIFAHHGT